MSTSADAVDNHGAAGAVPDAADDAQKRQDAIQSLFAGLKEKPWAFDFYGVMRRVETLQPQQPRFGKALRPTFEPLRLGQDPELDFAPAAVSSFEFKSHGAPRMGIRFFGLLGPHGPMPLHLTEYVRERLKQRSDPTSARFLDVFHHRMLSLFYRAWAQSQPAVQRDRPADDRYATWLGATLGLNPQLKARDSIPLDAKLFQAGLLGSRSRHPEGLAKLLGQFFRVKVRIQQHMPHWMPIDREDRSRLGYARNRFERVNFASAQLGATANAGHKVWDRQFKFRIELGPLTLAQYLAFLPGGTAWKRLHDWVRLYVGPDMIWDVELCLREKEVPPPRLGRHVRLGLTSWATGDPRSTRTPASSPTTRADRQGDRRDLHLRPATSFLLRQTGAHHHG